MPIILYAEDDPEQQAMVKLAFNGLGVTIVEAVDGQEALEKITKHRPDLILLDLFMPRIDGFGVLERLKNNSRTSYIPVIVISAWPTGDNRERARQAGAVDFIAKPYDPVKFTEQVGTHLNNALDAQSKQLVRKDTNQLSG